MLDDLRQLYQEVIIDHSRSPRHFGHPAHITHSADGDNPICGDQLTVYLTLNPETDHIDDIQFEGKGCAISTASASLMTDMLYGKSKDEAEKLFNYFHHLMTDDNQEAIAQLGTEISPDDLEILQVLAGVKQFPMRVKCATLAWHTMKAAFQNKKMISTE